MSTRRSMSLSTPSSPRPTEPKSRRLDAPWRAAMASSTSRRRCRSSRNGIRVTLVAGNARHSNLSAADRKDQPGRSDGRRYRTLDAVILPAQWPPLPRARQADREFGEFIGPAVDFDRAAVLLGDDVIGDR